MWNVFGWLSQLKTTNLLKDKTMHETFTQGDPPHCLAGNQLSQVPTRKHPKPSESYAIRTASSFPKTKMETI